MLYQLFAVMAPVLSGVLIGYLWAKRQAVDTAAMGKLVINIATPCLILSALNKTQLDGRQLLDIGLAAVLVMLLSGLLAWWLAARLKVERRIYVPGVVYSNNGNIGLPICFFAFGDAGLALAVVYFVVVALSHFSLGLMLFSGRFQLAPLLRSPIAWSALIAISSQLLSISWPLWLESSLSFMGAVANPLMLVMLGVSLAGLQLSGLRVPMLFALLRVVGGSLLGWLVAWLLGLSGLAMAVVILQASTASAAINYLLAKTYVGQEEQMAALVFGSTLLCLPFIALILPLLMALAA